MSRSLHFACQQGCIDCCDTRGYVYLTGEDLRSAAHFISLTAEEFERRYVYRTRHLLRLRKPPDRQCPFLSAQGCLIHPVKPTQCRLYPFWPEIVERADDWRAESVRCRGIGKGHLVQIGTAIETANQMRAAYPTMY
ncbi:MAG: YkgJ family cysteine cluster protein [Acidobacteriales bacterium]|nr:YkgJ family cysteine cluster protein [Terriglobales bacterium]